MYYYYYQNVSKRNVACIVVADSVSQAQSMGFRCFRSRFHCLQEAVDFHLDVNPCAELMLFGLGSSVEILG